MSKPRSASSVLISSRHRGTCSPTRANCVAWTARWVQRLTSGGETLDSCHTSLLISQVKGLPNPELMWLVNGQPIYPDLYHRMLVRENGVHSLVIDPVTQKNAGAYTCIASNKAGQSSFTLELKVVGKDFVEFQSNPINPIKGTVSLKTEVPLTKGAKPASSGRQLKLCRVTDQLIGHMISSPVKAG